MHDVAYYGYDLTIAHIKKKPDYTFSKLNTECGRMLKVFVQKKLGIPVSPLRTKRLPYDATYRYMTIIKLF